jgi:hypothetical protein
VTERIGNVGDNPVLSQTMPVRVLNRASPRTDPRVDASGTVRTLLARRRIFLPEDGLNSQVRLLKTTSVSKVHRSRAIGDENQGRVGNADLVHRIVLRRIGRCDSARSRRDRAKLITILVLCSILDPSAAKR